MKSACSPCDIGSVVGTKFVDRYFPDLIACLETFFGSDFCFWPDTGIMMETRCRNIVCALKDHLGDDEFLLTPLGSRPESPASNLIKIASTNPDKNFFVLTACPFAHEVFTGIKNLHVIHWGEEFELAPHNNFLGTSAVTKKLFDEPWHWLFLSNNVRFHRCFVAMILLGQNIPNGLIKFDPSPLLQHESWQSFQSYLKINDYHYLDFVPRMCRHVLAQGFNCAKKHQGYVNTNYSDRLQSTSQDFDSHAVGNFETYLRAIYEHSVIDIVAETVFIQRTGHVTEKFMNTVYGCTFFIYISMHGAVAHIRSLGFDVFDDIIDHGYDSIEDPYNRLFTAINTNIDILTSRDLAIKKWYQCQQRFHQNWLLAEHLYSNKQSRIVDRVRMTLDKITH